MAEWPQGSRPAGDETACHLLYPPGGSVSVHDTQGIVAKIAERIRGAHQGSGRLIARLVTIEVAGFLNGGWPLVASKSTARCSVGRDRLIWPKSALFAAPKWPKIHHYRRRSPPKTGQGRTSDERRYQYYPNASHVRLGRRVPV